MKRNSTFSVIGLTGGAGSGKSTVVEQIKQLVPMEFLHCDVIAHELMQPGGASYMALLKEFGAGVLEDITDDRETGVETALQSVASGERKAVEAERSRNISRAKLAKTAMATQKSRARLNELVHPLVRNELERRLEALQQDGFHGVTVIEAALLIEAGYTDLCDEVWYVTAPLEDRKRRMRENRGYSEGKIGQILDGQLSEEEFLKHADFVIQNPDKHAEEVSAELSSQIKERLENLMKPW